MKKTILLFLLLCCGIACEQQPDLSVYEANKALAEELMNSYVSPTDYDFYASHVADDIVHVSPMYGLGEVGKEAVLEQAKFYMNNFENVTFNDPVWLPGVNNETLQPDGGVRVYGTWKGTSKATGKSFSVIAYHYFEFKDGKISQSGDFFDATGMVMAVAPDEVTDEAESGEE
jgi:ketosteroid isomerase-like protein